MGRGLSVGPGSMEGLRWLARIGPCPLDAWRSAMNWSEVAARSHARRLESRGWLARQAMVRGDGCLFWATRSGTAEARVPARPIRRVTPAMWHQHCATAWMASWLKLRGHDVLGPRELLELPRWAAEIRWHDYGGTHITTHRPDLIAITQNGARVPIEIKLTRQTTAGLRAVLFQYAGWYHAGMSGGPLYVCATDHDSELIRKHARHVGLTEGDGGLRIELAGAIKRQALEMFRERRTATAE